VKENGTMATSVTIDWGEHDLPETDRRKWLGAWLVDRDGVEGDFFYDGNAGTTSTHEIPGDAVGFRLRCWPSDNPSATNSGGGVGNRPYATKPFWFETYDGSVVKAAELP
jgi:hypothetical protein